MRRIVVMAAVLIGTMFLLIQAHAQGGSRGKYGSDPLHILDTIASEANDEHRIQETALDDVSYLQGSYPTSYRMTNTIDSIRQNITPYLNRAYFIGLALAVFGLIITGLLMATSIIHGKGERGDVKKRLGGIIFGVLLLTGIYAIINIMMAALGRILG